MPIILDPATWSRDRLIATLGYHREALEETQGTLSHPDLKVRDPASLWTARELVEDVLLLTKAISNASSVPDEVLGGVVNVQYDALLAAIDLMKSHADVPKVPAPRRRRPTPYPTAPVISSWISRLSSRA